MKPGTTVQWIPGGPEIPTGLLSALEDGDLVLFCGAGISVPAGLPMFGGLVQRVFDSLPDRPSDVREYISSRQYDCALYAIELSCGRENVRRRVPPILAIADGSDRSTHRAILDLATGRDGTLRLVTTNFDRAFEGLRETIAIDCAPNLPIPKKERWKSLVHLHGRLSEDDSECANLVLTSADFGLAYLTEQWASRFVTELFRRFKILFVGYSVEDPVMRYMMDAFAADRAIGEGVSQAFVLAPIGPSNHESVARQWRQKGIVPILYDETGGSHVLLHNTLKHWAERHRSGLQGKEQIIRDNIGKPDLPSAIIQVCWALRDRSGVPARCFAEHDPVASVQWLTELEKEGLLSLHAERGGSNDLPLRAPLASSTPPGDAPSHISTLYLADWLVRHLDKPELIGWLIKGGAYLHWQLRFRIRRHLHTPSEAGLPAALRQFWMIVSSEEYAINMQSSSWRFVELKSLQNGDWNEPIRQELVFALTPVLRLREPWPLGDSASVRFSTYANPEVVLRADENWLRLKEVLRRHSQRDSILVDIADDLTDLLKRAMNLYKVVDQASALYDFSYIERPSIEGHSQNIQVRSWVELIPLLRDAFLELLKQDANRARRLVGRWMTIGFPLFRRFVFYAMAKSDLFEPTECLEALLESDARWLWASYTQRELFQLLIALWPKLDDTGTTRLIEALLAGPPRSLFRDDMDDETYARILDRSVFVRLNDLEKTGRPLLSDAAVRLAVLRLRFKSDEEVPEREHFPSWSSPGFGDPFESFIRPEHDLRNKTEDEVLDILADPESHPQEIASWNLLVQDQFDRAVDLLIQLADIGMWPSTLWTGLLAHLNGQGRLVEYWNRLCPYFSRYPKMADIANEVAYRFHELSKGLPLDGDECFWTVWDRTVEAVLGGPELETGTDPLTLALNSSPGNLAESALNRITLRNPVSASDVPEHVWKRLANIARHHGPNSSLAAAILASRLGSLFSLNPDWVSAHLIPFFAWSNNPYAAVVWSGYFWQFSVPPNLWPLIKRDFLIAVGRSSDLGRDLAESAASWFAAICIDRPDWIESAEATVALQSMNERCRGSAARLLWGRLGQAGADADQLWRERIGPWLDSTWPRDLDLRGASSSSNLALVAVHTTEQFPNAARTVGEIIGPTKDFSEIVEQILTHNQDLPRRFPEDLLAFLARIVDRSQQWPYHRLRAVLDGIAASWAECTREPSYRDLDEYLRRYNQ
jgi:hypothetical protein